MPFKLLPQESPKESSTLESIARAPAVGLSGALAAVPGTFGDIGKFINDLLAAPISKAITGKPGIPYEETPIGKFLPTTQQHLENLQRGIPALKPKNDLEKFTLNTATDAAQLFLPGKIFKMGQYGLSGLRSLGISLLGNIGGETTKRFTGDEKKGDLVKATTMLGFSLFNPTTAKNISSNLYKKAEELLPENATTSANTLFNSLSNLENKILKGRPRKNISPSEEFVLSQVDKFLNLIKDNKVNVPQIVAQKRSLSEELQNQLFNIPNRSEKARTRELAQNLIHASKKTLQEYGNQNPNWQKLHSAADTAHSAIAKSNYVSRVLEKYLKGKPDSLAHIFGIGIPAGLSYVDPMMALGTTAGYQGTKYMTRILKSPELAKHYSKVIGAAVADNHKQIERELNSLEKKVEIDQKKRKVKYRLIPQS